MLADAQALPSLRRGMILKWADDSAMLESFSRPRFREAVVFQPMHWYNEFQLQKSMLKDRPNVHPGDMLIHCAGLMEQKAEFMEPWLDRAEVRADRWTVPLENTTYLRDVKEFWNTYSEAKDMIDRGKQNLSLMLRDTELRKAVVKALDNLQNMVWEAAGDVEGMQSHTEFLGDTLQQAIRQNSDRLKAGTQAPGPESGILGLGRAKTKLLRAET